eukprot:508919-Pyramimonas_sp.AAC.1
MSSMSVCSKESYSGLFGDMLARPTSPLPARAGASRTTRGPRILRALGQVLGVPTSRCEPIEYHCCRYGAPYKKPTVFVTNLLELKSLRESACASSPTSSSKAK